MTEAQERNLIRFVIGNSIRLDDMYEEYLAFCLEEGRQKREKADFAQEILKKYRIVTIEGNSYIFGAMKHGDTRPKPSMYVKNTPPIDRAEWVTWMDEHAWKPEL